MDRVKRRTDVELLVNAFGNCCAVLLGSAHMYAAVAGGPLPIPYGDALLVLFALSMAYERWSRLGRYEKALGSRMVD